MSAAATSCGSGLGLSDDQFQKLVSILQQQQQPTYANSRGSVAASKLSSKISQGKHHFFISTIALTRTPDMWILDSGTTNHIICSLDYYDSYKLVIGLVVNMPNGGTTAVRFVGEVKLNSGTTLLNVLYIPTFNFNI